MTDLFSTRTVKNKKPPVSIMPTTAVCRSVQVWIFDLQVRPPFPLPENPSD
jgi:hypothetical protein